MSFNVAILLAIIYIAFSTDGGLAAEPNSPFLLECRIPTPRNSSLPLNESVNESSLTPGEEILEQLELEGRCFVACATTYYSNEVGMKSYSISDYWPFINDSETECTTSSNVHECTRGCIHSFQIIEVGSRSCTEFCAGNCSPGECDSRSAQCHPWIHAGCPIMCNTNIRVRGHPCNLGCHHKLELHLSEQKANGSLPLHPTGPPRLMPDRSTGRAGQYIVDLSEAAPQPQDGEVVNRTNISAVMFLFRFEDMNSSNVFFNWTVSPSARLDLFHYACRDLSVSFAVSNIAGLSNFSSPTLVKVYGDERLIPNPPTDIYISEEIDTRVEFFGHVILNISWEEPQNDAYLDNYTVTVSSSSGVNTTLCGSGIWSTTVPHNNNSISIEAETSDSLPVMSCRYDIKVYSIGVDGKSSPLLKMHLIQTLFDPQYITFECQRLQHTAPELLYNVTWSLPPFLLCGNVISGFIVIPKFTLKIDDVNFEVQIDNISVPLPQGSSLTFSTVLNSSDHSTSDIRSSRVYFLEMYVMWNSSNIPYVPQRYAYTCGESTITAHAPPQTSQMPSMAPAATSHDSSSSSNTMSHDSSSSSNIGIIAGSSVGGIVLVALLTCCICLSFCYVRMLRRRKKLFRSTQEPFDPIFSSGSKNVLFGKQSAAFLMSPSMDEWEIPASEVIMEKLLGEGAFGEVYKGIVKCPIVNPKVRPSSKSSLCTTVAIKLLKLSAKGNERQDFLSEIEMMKKVAEAQNPHVVGLLGCVTIQEPLCLITEFVKYGDLLSYLRTNRKKFTNSNTDEEEDAYLELGNVSPVDLISFAYQIASGMEYLSSLGIVHRDLACRNILVDEGKVLKISDLGMSRETDEIYVQKRTGRVPLKWMAIESIIAREFTSASDVWAYGIVLWEIGTLGGFPYPTIQNEEFLPLLKRGYRMEKPDNCSSEVYEIMLKCWDEQPHNRPTFKELRSKFDAMLLADKKDEYIDLRIDQTKSYYQNLPSPPPAANNAKGKGSSTSLNTHAKSAAPKPNRKECLISKPAATNGKLRSPSPSELNADDRVNSKDYLISERQTRASSAERIGSSSNSRMYENTGRPVSMYLSRDDTKHQQNPYVDEPSKVATAALTLPNTNGWPEHLGGSEGVLMMEMNPMDNHDSDMKQWNGEQNQCPEIQICTCEDKN